MKLNFLIFTLVALLIASCHSRQETFLDVINLSDQQRDDASILLTRGEISNWTEIPDETLPILLDRKGKNLPSQADDVNGDGEWDELFAQINMAPKKQKKIILRFVDPADYPVFKTRTNLRLGDANRLEGVSYHNHALTEAAFQMEGCAWENDRVAFRNYLDQRNGIDIFGKLTNEMILDSVGIAGGPNYHEPDKWGMDLLKVGTSLGAGGIGYMFNDSIYRVGDNGSGSYHVVFEGSQRSRFNLTFNNWMINESAINVVQQIEISAGKHYYQSSVTYSGSDLDLNLVVGIVNMKSDEVHILKLGDHHTALVTHDLQAEDTTMLTMALMIPNNYLIRHGESKEQGEGIIQTYYAVLEAHPGDPVPYRFYALWEREDPRWASLNQVVNFLEEEAARSTQSVVYKILH